MDYFKIKKDDFYRALNKVEESLSELKRMLLIKNGVFQIFILPREDYTLLRISSNTNQETCFRVKNEEDNSQEILLIKKLNELIMMMAPHLAGNVEIEAQGLKAEERISDAAKLYADILEIRFEEVIERHKVVILKGDDDANNNY